MKMLPFLGVIVLLGLTLFSTLIGATKIYQTTQKPQKLVSSPQPVQVLGEQIIQSQDINPIVEEPTVTPVVPKTATQVKTASVKTILPTPIKLNLTPTPAIKSATIDPNAGKCIITLFGGQYDVTELRLTHSGGDVFACGTDMTASYQSRHGTSLVRMEKYKITGSQPGLPVVVFPPTYTIPTTTPKPRITPTPINREEDDDRDEIDRERDEDEDEEDDEE